MRGVINRKYLGEYRYGKTIFPSAYPAIVTQKM